MAYSSVLYGIQLSLTTAVQAVQQATGAIAMGPIMTGLNKPVNDLSRGCTVPDIINTVCATSIQALQGKDAV